MPWDDDFEAYASNRKKTKSKEKIIMYNLEIGDYAWSNKSPTGGRILEETYFRNYAAFKVRKADTTVRVFLAKNLTRISRRTFGRRTGVSSLPMKIK